MTEHAPSPNCDFPTCTIPTHWPESPWRRSGHSAEKAHMQCEWFGGKAAPENNVRCARPARQRERGLVLCDTHYLLIGLDPSDWPEEPAAPPASAPFAEMVRRSIATEADMETARRGAMGGKLRTPPASTPEEGLR